MDEAAADADDDAFPTAPLTTWLLLIFIAILSFWCQATVTEERFVPALNVIANRFNIPDDVAGATLMAAGASSPELFSSIVALFVTHSALGLGTIVGSEIFNQLTICAGSVLAAKGGTLKLDRAIVTREVGFYALSIGLLYNALKDRRPDPDDPDAPAWIYISLADAALLFGAYVLYVIVCGNFDAIMGCFRPRKKAEAESLARGARRRVYGSLTREKSKRVQITLEDEDMPFLQQVGTREPRENFAHKRTAPPASQKDLMKEAAEGGRAEVSTVSLYGTLGASERPEDRRIRSVTDGADGGIGSGAGDNNSKSVGFAESGAESGEVEGGGDSNAISDQPENTTRSLLGRFSDGLSVRLFTFIAGSEKPSDQHDLYDLEVNAFEERIQVFLWQRSIFYNKAKVALNGWNLRWFNFGHDRIVSVPDRRRFEEHQLKYPKFREMEVDEERLILKLINPVDGKRDYYLMAPSSQIFEVVVKKCEDLMKVWEERTTVRTSGSGHGSGDAAPDPVEIEAAFDDEDLGDDVGGDEGSGREGDADAEPSLIEFPSGEGCFAVLCYVVLFPLKLLMHLTIPDVRHLSSSGDPQTSLLWAFLAVVSCLIWLIVGSYAMVASLEALADLLDIPDAVIGVTVSAAGTSLPNYVASQCAARQGFGNMAVSNAFGSNTFNILVGLGLPWLLYIAAVTGGEPYAGLRDEGITSSVIILGTVLAAFVLLLLCSGFVLYRWHAPVFLGVYGLYLAYAIGQVYVGN